MGNRNPNTRRASFDVKLSIIAITNPAPAWVQTGLHDYLKRFPKNFSLELIEISPKKNKKNTIEILTKNCFTIALSIEGQHFSTEQLAEKLSNWREQYSSIAFIIGDHNGLSPSILKKVNYQWSLSALTFPHFLARLLVVEQIYRAWTILNNHPYHLGH